MIYFFHGWCDENLYKNSPERFLENMPADHPYIRLYNQKKNDFFVWVRVLGNMTVHRRFAI